MRYRALFLVIVLIVTACTDQDTVVIKGNKIKVEIADDPAERTNGLMYRGSLEKDSGMLFIFDQESEYSFWMKNTPIPLDMIFISADHKIVDILEAEPCAQDPCPFYTPKSPAKYVLEVNKGYSHEKGINIDDNVNIKIKG